MFILGAVVMLMLLLWITAVFTAVITEEPTMNVTKQYEYIDPKERLNLMTVHANELARLVKELSTLDEIKPVEANLLDIANRHLVNGMEVLKGIKFGRA
jgi:hypothetical protein